MSFREPSAREDSVEGRAHGSTSTHRAAATFVAVLSICFLLFAIGAVLMLRDKTWAWIAVVIALPLGLFFFVRDVDFSAPLGIQF